jgi:hypothetical protein
MNGRGQGPYWEYIEKKEVQLQKRHKKWRKRGERERKKRKIKWLLARLP